MSRAFSAVPLLAAASLAAGCHSSGGKSGTSSVGVAIPVSVGLENRAVARVLESSAGRALSFFPHRVGTRSCVVPEGGPAGLRIKGVCSARSSVFAGSSRYAGQTIVVLREVWPWRSFHADGSERRLQHHSWRFVVLSSGRVIAVGESGDFPPQDAK
jgi:hypothetical protein